MIRVTAGVRIARSPGEVFAFLADFENNPHWQSGMSEARFTSEPPLRVGSTYDQTAVFLGRRIESSFEVVAFEPGSSVTIQTTSGSFPIKVTRRVAPAGSGASQVTAVVEGDPAGFYRLASPLLRWMVKRSVRRDYRRLRNLLEARA